MLFLLLWTGTNYAVGLTMNLLPLIALSAALIMTACGSRSRNRSASSAFTSAPDAQPEPGPTALRVFLSAALLEVPVDLPASALADQSLPKLAMNPAIVVVSSPHLLLADGQTAELQAGSEIWKAKPEALDQGRVRVNLGVSRLQSSPADAFQTSVVVAARQNVVVPTPLHAPAKRSMVLLVSAQLIRNDDDLRLLHDAKQKERQAALTAAPANQATPVGHGRPCSSEVLSKITKVSSSEVVVERSILNDTCLSGAGAALAPRIVPEVQDGKLMGIRVFGLRAGSLLAELGVENGDRIETIDGLAIANPEDALRAYARARTADRLDVVLNRHGKPFTLHVAIR